MARLSRSNYAITAIDKAYTEARKLPADAHGVTWIPTWHAQAGVISQVRQNNIAVLQRPVNPPVPNVVLLQRAQVEVFCNIIDYFHVGSDHLHIKDNELWQNLYWVADRPLPRINRSGNNIAFQTESVPCHNCGFIVRYKEMQVDHHEPQEGGNYLLKIFRAIGLTVGAATGSKGSNFNNLDLMRIHPKYRDPGSYDHLNTNTTDASKWTTNAQGDFLLSLFKLNGADFYDLERFCMNSLLNLVPLCRECNGTKSNRLRRIV